MECKIFKMDLIQFNLYTFYFIVNHFYEGTKISTIQFKPIQKNYI